MQHAPDFVVCFKYGLGSDSDIFALRCRNAKRSMVLSLKTNLRLNVLEIEILICFSFYTTSLYPNVAVYALFK